MDAASQIMDKTVVFRHKGKKNLRLGVVNAIYKKKNVTFAKILLDKSENTGFLSQLKSLFSEEGNVLHVPLQLLQVLTDTEKTTGRGAECSETRFSNVPIFHPYTIRFKDKTYDTVTNAQTRKRFKITMEVGECVIWNKTSENGDIVIGSVVLFSVYHAFFPERVEIRVLIDFEEVLPKLYQQEFLETRDENGTRFRYFAPYEELVRLTDYFQKFQISWEPEDDFSDTANETNGVKQYTGPSGKKISTDQDLIQLESGCQTARKENNDRERGTRGIEPNKPSHDDTVPRGYTTTPTWQTQRNRNRKTDDYQITSQYNYKTEYFATCCYKDYCNIENVQIPVGSTVTYVTSDDVPICGTVSWVGNAGIYERNELHAKLFASLQFESTINNSAYFNIMHYNCFSADCKENKQLLIYINDLKHSSHFEIYPLQKKIEENFEDGYEEEESAEIPPHLKFQSVRHKLHDSTRWGFQGSNNSCYADTTLFSLFAFTDAFDSLLNAEVSLKDEAAALDSDKEKFKKSTAQILRNYIVRPLRKNFQVQKSGVARLRQVLSKVNLDFKTSHMDAEDFMLCLFDTVLGAPHFFQYDKDSTDYIHQIMLPVEEDVIKDYIPIQELLELSFFTSQVQLENVPQPGFIIKLPVSAGKLMGCKYILPNMSLDLRHVLKDPTGKSMSLLSVICLQGHHFTCYIRSGSDWLFYDSNPSEEKPSVIHLPKMEEMLMELMDCKLNRKSFPPPGSYYSEADKKYGKHLTSSPYMYIYV